MSRKERDSSVVAEGWALLGCRMWFGVHQDSGSGAENMSGQQEIRGEQVNATAGNEQEQGTQTGRDERGRFSKGAPGGPGNPFTRQVAENRKAMMEAMNPVAVHGG